MKKLIIILLALMIFNPVVNAAKKSDIGLINNELEKVTIQLKWFHQFQFAGYYAAIEKGFYAEEGLEVELRQRVAGTSHLNDVLQGRAQYGTADAGGLLIERLQGKPVVLLAQIFQHSPLVLVVREDSGIRVAKDMAGKRITIDVVGHSDMPLFAMLLDTFGGLDAVKIQPHSFNPQDLIDGKTDAYGSYLTNHPDWFRQQSVAVNIINPRDYGIDFYGDNLFTTEQELRDHPDRVEKIRRATLKGWHYALDNREEMIDLVLDKYNSQGTNRDHLAYEARETEKLILPDLIEIGSFELDRYKDIANTYASAGYVEKTTLDPGFFYQANASQPQIKLSAEEQAWIAEHPEITLGFTAEIEPLLIAGEDGQLSGILIDIYDELESRTGIKINIELDEWLSTIQKARDGKVDGLLVSAFSLAEDAGLIHSHILTTGVPTLFAKNDAPFEINSEKDLEGKKISVLKGVYVVEQALKPYKDAIEIVETESALEMMMMVLDGKVDAAYGLSYHHYLIGKYMLFGIEPVYFSHEIDASTVVSIRAEWPEFISIMNKTLDSIGQDGLNAINQKWTQLESGPGFQKQMQSLVSTEVDHLFSTLSERLRSNINDLLSANRDGIPRDQDEHLAMVKHLSSSYPFLQTINYIDADNRIQYVSPVESNQKVIGLKINLPAPLDALKAALASGQSALSTPFEIVQGLMGYSLMTAHPRKGALEQVFRAEAIFSPNSSFRQQNEIALRVSDNGKIVYTSPDFRSDGRPVALATGEIMGRHFQIEAITSTTLPLMLSEEERRWLWEHPEVILGTDQGWRPYVVVEKDGSVSGIEVDLIKRINELTGANIRLELGKWPDMVEKAEKREIDGLAISAYHAESEPYFLFTNSSYSTTKYIYTRKPVGTKLKNMDELAGKRVAVLRGNRADEKFLQRPVGIIAVAAESNEELISMLVSERVDAVISGINFRLAVQEKLIPDIDISFIVPDSETEILYSVRKDWPELQSIMNKALAAIPLVERLAIQERWGKRFRTQPFTTELDLSAEEKSWLDTNQVINICVDPNWMPFEQINEAGEYEGMVADYMELFSNHLGISFELYPTKTYEESLSALSSGECILLSSGLTDEAVRKGLVTKEYLSITHVFAVHQDVPFIHDINEFANRRIGTVLNYPPQYKLEKLFPETELVLVENVDIGIRMVASGELDAFVESMTAISYSIQNQRLSNVKIGSIIPGEIPLTMMANKNGSFLIPILNKAIDSITRENHKEIADRWISVHFERGVDYTLFWQVMAVVTIVLALFLYWNRRLSREVKARQSTEVHLQRAKEAAESANKAKSTFLANMSHEIRTPMNAVLGFAEILKHEESDPKKTHYIESIYAGGKALLNLINDILDLSKVEAGKLELQYSAVPIDKLLDEIKVIFEHKTRDKGLEFIIKKLNAVPMQLVLDETRVRQVLINLLGNAVKFTNSGFIKVSVSGIKKGCTSDSRINLSIIVEDSGVGIPEDQCKRIFEAFEQTKGQKTKEYGGTGLGLSITKRLVEMMGGEIYVESIVGNGATFHIDLKNVEIASVKEVDKKKTTLNEKSIDFDPASILVVDDIDYNREVLVTFLKPWKFSIIEAENGLEGLAQARKHKPDMILLDMKMPEMDGYEMSEQLYNDDELKDITIIAITASALKQDEEVISKLCDGYLRKPISQADLILELMKHLPYTVVKEPKEKQREPVILSKIIFPPQEKLIRIINASKDGNMTEFGKCIAEIRELGLKYQPFVNKIEFWSNNFQFEEIIYFLQQYLERSH